MRGGKGSSCNRAAMSGEPGDTALPRRGGTLAARRSRHLALVGIAALPHLNPLSALVPAGRRAVGREHGPQTGSGATEALRRREGAPDRSGDPAGVEHARRLTVARSDYSRLAFFDGGLKRSATYAATALGQHQAFGRKRSFGRCSIGINPRRPLAIW